MKKKTRIKLKMLLLFILLITILIISGIFIYKIINNKSINNPSTQVTPDEIVKPNEENKDEPIEVPTTFLNQISNNSNVKIEKEWEDIIVNYMNLFYKSIFTLKVEDFTLLFSNIEEGYITQTATSMLIDHRNLQPNDMHLTSAKYDIIYNSVKIEDDKVAIEFLENDYLKFKYLKDVESKAYSIKNTIILTKVNNQYKIESLRKVQDYYVMITNVYESTDDYKNSLDSLKLKYIKLMKEELEKNKRLQQDAFTNSYVSKKKCDNKYEAQKVVDYTYKYINKFNSEWVNYNPFGGNCQNFVSQSIYQGGIPMDTKGNMNLQWKHYSSVINSQNTASGRSYSWTNVNHFYNYAKENTGYGLCSEVDVNLFYADPGDVFQVGFTVDYGHSLIIVDLVKNEKGEVIEFLVNCNNINLENYPLLSYTYPNKRLIKILGWNN